MARNAVSLIDENAAWDILRAYARDCLKIDSASLLAIYAIGSLPAGYYRSGQSDIDALLIVQDGSESVWGSSMHPSKPLEEQNRRYRDTYGIPKDFGPFPIQESELFPPYDVQQELVPEIARLKLEGKPIYGAYDLDTFPLPTPDDYVRYVQHFEGWWRDEFSKSVPLEDLSPTACVNTILMHLRRFLWIKRGVIEFDKRQLVRCYLESDPPFAENDMLFCVEQSLESEALSDTQTEQLRAYTGRLRSHMNAYLGIGA
jgi:hypothetical protein